MSRPAPDAAPSDNALTLRENGPLELRGDVALAGERIGDAVVLCRCGQSAGKPYCDGSHVRSGFTASGTAAGLEPVTAPTARGRVNVRPIHDGPLRIEGAVDVLADSGVRLGRASELWLCRCGESGRKPFCDGTHKRSGFRADGEVPPRKPRS